jgi:DNA polymerase-3 subunit epsilon
MGAVHDFFETPGMALASEMAQYKVIPPEGEQTMNASMEQLAQQLEASGEYRVLRKLTFQETYAPGERVRVRRGLVLDVETTGLNAQQDVIIELAMIPFDYAPQSGTVVKVYPPICYLQDPGRPIPPEITTLTGISDVMVQGQQIDEALVIGEFAAAALIIAHNARFDRPFIERRFPSIAGKAWACSLQEIPWRAEGFSATALEFLLFKRCGLFFGSHRAEADCLALLHLLATPFADGRMPLALLLAAAREVESQIWAIGAPFEAKDQLKARGYRWSTGDQGRPKAWYCTIPAAQEADELAWLQAHVYGGQPGQWQIKKRDATTRYVANADG